MCYHLDSDYGAPVQGLAAAVRDRGRLVTDGGTPDDETDSGHGENDEENTDDGDDPEEPGDSAATPADDGDDVADSGGSPEPGSGPDGSNVEVTDEAEPAEPKWEEPDLDELPEFELGAEGPLTKGVGSTSGSPESGPADGEAANPGAGMPNTARSPEATRISADGTEAYVVAFEVCARLPDDVRLPEEAAELVPAAVEAELEEDVQQFAAAEFGIQTPHVDVLDFEEVDEEVWLRLRIGLPSADFADLDPEAVRSYALEQLEGVL